jgi:beta-lactam-binding protein with PASTA domain
MEWADTLNAQGAEVDVRIYEEYRDGIGDGMVLSQYPFNQFVAVNESIELVVSLGEGYTIPDFKYYTKDSIESICESNGVEVVFEYVESDETVSGRYVSQYPEAGTIMSKSEFIRVQLAK